MSKKLSWILGFFFLVTLGIAGGQGPNGTGRVVFVSDRDGHQNLWVMDLTSLELQQITFFPNQADVRSVEYTRWSNDGKMVAFTGWGPSFFADLYIINDDGSDLRKLTNLGEAYAARNAVWDPVDPNVVYYIKHAPLSESITGAVHRLNIATGIDETIPNSSGRHTQSFDINPAGTEILFTREYNCCWAYNMYTGYQNLDGTFELIIKPPDGLYEYLGRINKNDDWIVYHQGPPGNEIFKMDKDGHNMSQLTFGSGNSFPVWTSGDNNGNIIFSSYDFGNSEIVMMKADGISYPSGAINLTNNPAYDSWPDWTPYGYARYAFEGFSSPIENEPTINKAKAGQTIPVKWRLIDKDGLAVSDPASFKSITSYSVSCANFQGDPIDEIEEYAAGSSGLQYLGDGYWQFNWKTSKAYAGYCRIVRLTLNDDSVHTASFTFK